MIALKLAKTLLILAVFYPRWSSKKIKQTTRPPRPLRRFCRAKGTTHKKTKRMVVNDLPLKKLVNNYTQTTVNLSLICRGFIEDPQMQNVTRLWKHAALSTSRNMSVSQLELLYDVISACISIHWNSFESSLEVRSIYFLVFYNKKIFSTEFRGNTSKHRTGIHQFSYKWRLMAVSILSNCICILWKLNVILCLKS